MVMDFTELPEQLHTNQYYTNKMKLLSIILFVSFILTGCSEKNEQLTGSTEYKEVISTDIHLTSKVRSVYYDSLLFTGKITETSGNNIVSISEYKAGKLHGEQLTYFLNGKINEQRYYENGCKTGEHKGWWAGGELRFIYHFKNDVFDGNVKVWNEKGMLFNDFNYVNGQEDGSQKAWFANGDIQANYVAKGNRKYGITGVKNCQTISGDIVKK